MKKRTIIALCAIFGCLALTAIGAYGWHRSLIASFPMWREIEEMKLSEHPLGSAQVLGIETIAEGNLAWDELRLSLTVPEESFYALEFTSYTPYYIDYHSLDGWHNIWEGSNMMAFVSAREPSEASLRLPSGLFCMTGQYRARFERGDKEVGRCIFQIAKPTKRMEDMEDNDFPIWRPADESRDVANPSISLSVKGIAAAEDWDRPGLAPQVLKYGLKCSAESYSSCGDCWRLDYLHEGEWYTVGGNTMCMLMACFAEPVPGLEYIKEQDIPEQVLEHEGTYRLYLSDRGYCEFCIGPKGKLDTAKGVEP